MEDTTKNQEKESGEQRDKRWNQMKALAIIFTVLTMGFYVVYTTDRPKLTIDEDMLGTDVREGKVLSIYAGDAPIPPTKVDYTVKSYFGKPIGNVKFLVDVSALNAIEFRQYDGTYSPSEVLIFKFDSTDNTAFRQYDTSNPSIVLISEFVPKDYFHGYFSIRANQSLKLSKGETRFVNMNIYADWLDYRPKGLEEATDYWTSEPIETVTVKLYG